MGEIPKTVTVHFDDEDTVLAVYVCGYCEKLFASEESLDAGELICPVCGSMNTDLLIELT